jgi:purine nucleoside permease
MKEPTVTKAVIIDVFQKELKPWISIYIYLSLRKPVF